MRFATLVLSSGVLCSCTTLKTIDASLYGAPPAKLHSDVTVYVSFDHAMAVSRRCGTSAFGPIGALLPVHGCVQAKAGEPINLITSNDGDLSGTTRIVDFVSPARAQYLCDTFGIGGATGADLPNGVCMYKVVGEDDLRVVWPNPCATNDLYMCHELGHVNQFASGWVEASLLSPLNHWGRAPTGSDPQGTLTRFAKAEPDESGDTADLTFAGVSNPTIDVSTSQLAIDDGNAYIWQANSSPGYFMPPMSPDMEFRRPDATNYYDNTMLPAF